jgi:hypothetical protein
MRENPVPVGLLTVGDKLSAWLGFGPSFNEVEEVAYDLIVRHGIWAYDEAIHLSEVARLMGSSRNAKLYRLAANHTKISFEVAWKNLREMRTNRAARH